MNSKVPEPYDVNLEKNDWVTGPLKTFHSLKTNLKCNVELEGMSTDNRFSIVFGRFLPAIGGERGSEEK